ncbi:MAG: rRNA pseudouridine synthase [Chlamydiales bacterium]|nr:rRNA pseudouridine synthase [Chlamydiales bacterium]
MAVQRLAKILAQAGLASRRSCEDLIFAGRVKLNNTVVYLPQTMVNPSQDTICVDHKPIALEKKVYLIFNKPKGYICSNVPDRRTIYRFFTDIEQRLFSIGRLDKDTEGLLILTNDGLFAQNIIHPSKNILKEYIVKTNKEISDDHLKTISKGTLIENVFIRPQSVEKIRKGTLRITISEGKKHEVRKLVECADLKIYALKRTRIGGLHLGLLPIGAFRELTEKEKLLVFQ